jgi:hypothetical protein
MDFLKTKCDFQFETFKGNIEVDDHFEAQEEDWKIKHKIVSKQGKNSEVKIIGRRVKAVNRCMSLKIEKDNNQIIIKRKFH